MEFSNNNDNNNSYFKSSWLIGKKLGYINIKF